MSPELTDPTVVNTPGSSVVSPHWSEPQHVTVPSRRIPQFWLPPEVIDRLLGGPS